MKKYAALLLSWALASFAHADDAKGETSFWDQLRQKVEQIMPQKQMSTTTAVGGVRGADVEANDMYWKGEARAIDPAELTAFQKALSLAGGDKKDEAKSAFSDFVKAYPDSPLRNDADKAILMLDK